ncbi:host cell division inhibitor Icd-like protein [Pantoea dispersa]|uniref:host cell division inhibitor Icd-like protein n=2 Tax=Pantoea dispersa TaxID=59814 RepID=UPI0030B93040
MAIAIRPIVRPLTGATVVVMNKPTQTRPKYQYRFLAVSREDRSAPPFRLCIDADSEQEARSILAPYFILSFTGQQPADEGEICKSVNS